MMSNEPAFTNISDFDIKMIVGSEWDPWSHCDGCQSLRHRTSKCRVKLRINKSVNKQYICIA